MGIIDRNYPDLNLKKFPGIHVARLSPLLSKVKSRARLVAALWFAGRLCYLPDMKSRHAVALALVGCTTALGTSAHYSHPTPTAPWTLDGYPL